MTQTKIASLFIILFLFFISANITGKSDHRTITCLNLKKKPIHLRYNVENNMDYRFKVNRVGKVNLPRTWTIEGKMARALRFENITRMVENRYCLPEGILMAMIMQETMGMDCKANWSPKHPWGDGGFGICHIQGVVGEEYGLNTVCDESCGEKDSPFKCYRHARILGKAMTYLDNCDASKYSSRDDRLHPILNLDAVGRILARKKGDIEDKVKFYRGGTKEQREKYWLRVKSYHRNLQSEWRRKKVSAEFNRINRHLLIDGERANNPFDEWLEVYHFQNVNYGLWDYASLGDCPNCCGN